MKYLETDDVTGAEIFEITNGDRIADNIYGEQPYSSADGNRIAVRYFDDDGKGAELAIVDLTDGTEYTILPDTAPFPAFHAWSDSLYFHVPAGKNHILKRCDYHTLKQEDVLELPAELGRYSYGTVSPDHAWYAVSVHRDGGVSSVVLFDMKTGEHRVIAEPTTDYYFKHEQFSLDGKNRVLIQANRMPDVKQVLLGSMETDGEGITWFAADRPHTPRPTGHECWIGKSDTILFSTATDSDDESNLWTVKYGAESPTRCTEGLPQYAHVSASLCGKYWLADTGREDGVPIYAGSFESGVIQRIVFSRTVMGREQWTHAHPFLTTGNRWLIYNSTWKGTPHVFGARVPENFWQEF